MHVSQENIEELFFDYFEGNLSDTDKTELLQFVHLHPEFEKDFAQWAQAYVPVEESVPDYGIAGSLLRKPPVLFPFKQWVLGGAISVSLVALLSVPFWKSSEKETSFPSPIVTDSPNVTPQSVAENKEALELKSPIKVSGANRIREQDRLVEQPVFHKTEEMVAANASWEAPLSPESATEKIGEKETVVEEVAKPMEAQPDSLLLKAKKEIKSSAPLKRKKQKLPLNLKPSPNFMPVNDNF